MAICGVKGKAFLFIMRGVAFVLPPSPGLPDPLLVTAKAAGRRLQDSHKLRAVRNPRGPVTEPSRFRNWTAPDYWHLLEFC